MKSHLLVLDFSKLANIIKNIKFGNILLDQIHNL
jgi:hypothetical protein